MHEDKCDDRFEVEAVIKASVEDAQKEGRPFFSPLVLQEWYQNKMGAVVDYAVSLIPPSC